MLEKLFGPQPKPELSIGLSKEAGKLLAKANHWAEKQTTSFKLERQPFSLSKQEIEVIHTRLTEIRAEELLEKMPLRKAPEILETKFKLPQYFEQLYQGTLQNVIEKYEVVKDNEVNAVRRYLENCKNLAPNFAKRRSSFGELISVCNQIRGKRPVIFLIKTPSFNT